MRRSRGDRSLTTSPPISTSPEVGTSSPAIMRSKVVLPDPDGPRKTRNSPSSVTRSTSFTAPGVPGLKTLVTARVSTIAMELSGLLPAREDALVLGIHRLGGVLGLGEQRLGVLQRLDRLLGVDGDLALGVLLGAAERPQERAERHAGVELLGQAEPAGVAVLVADLLGALAQVVPGVRPLGEAGLGPPVLVVVAGVRDVGVRECEVALRLGVEGRLLGKLDHLAVLLLDLLDDVRHVDRLLLERGRGRQEHE